MSESSKSSQTTHKKLPRLWLVILVTLTLNVFVSARIFLRNVQRRPLRPPRFHQRPGKQPQKQRHPWSSVKRASLFLWSVHRGATGRTNPLSPTRPSANRVHFLSANRVHFSAPYRSGSHSLSLCTRDRAQTGERATPPPAVVNIRKHHILKIGTRGTAHGAVHRAGAVGVHAAANKQ